MALELLPPSMLKAIDLLPDAKTPVTLFTRHSIREVVTGQGLAGYDLQLTHQGRDLAEAWGSYLIDNTDRVIQHCISSPIQRCIDTAALMIQGADGQTLEPNTHRIEIIEQGLLVEPGSFVLDIKQAGPYFQRQGALGFINSFVNNALPGMKHPIHGVVDVLELIYNTHPNNPYGLSLAVSHDTILAAILAV
ncbi:MAG: histidine phosphatase family protein, partial [Acinetobacter johnsonii]